MELECIGGMLRECTTQLEREDVIRELIGHDLDKEIIIVKNFLNNPCESTMNDCIDLMSSSIDDQIRRDQFVRKVRRITRSKRRDPLVEIRRLLISASSGIPNITAIARVLDDNVETRPETLRLLVRRLGRFIPR